MSRPHIVLAALADVDIRTAAKACAMGARAVRGRPGERIAEAAASLGMVLPIPQTQGGPPPSSSPPQAA